MDDVQPMAVERIRELMEGPAVRPPEREERIQTMTIARVRLRLREEVAQAVERAGRELELGVDDPELSAG